jgi:hypothetical protein
MPSLVLYKVLKRAATYFCAVQTAAAVTTATGLGRLILFLKTSDMSQQFFFISHAGKIPAKHCIRPQGRLTFRCCPMCAKRVKRGTDGWRLALFSSLTTWVVGQISRDFANQFYKVLGAGYFFPLFFGETAAVRTNCIAWSTFISTGLILALGTMTVKPPN